MTTTKKISELPAAVTPLDGDEVLPIVQNNATRRATVNEIKAGLAADDHNHTLSDIADAGTAAGGLHRPAVSRAGSADQAAQLRSRPMVGHREELPGTDERESGPGLRK